MRKGERAIWILAPMARKITSEDEETREETTRRIITGFRGAAVFDVAQTDGAALAEPVAAKLEGDAPAELWNRLEIVRRREWLPRDPGDSEHGANGYTDPSGKRVVVDPEMSPRPCADKLWRTSWANRR